MKRGSAGRLKLLYVLSVACLTACAADPFGIAIPPTERVPSAPSAMLIWKTFAFSGSGRPDADSSTVFVLDRSATIRAFARSTGQNLWENRLPVSNPFSELTVAGDVVIVPSTPDIFGIDTKTGSMVWRYVNADLAFGSSVTSSNSSVFVELKRGTGMMIAIDARTGVERWRQSIVPQDSSVRAGEFFRVSGSHFDDGKLYVSFNLVRGTLDPMRGGIAALSETSGMRLWSRMLPVVATDKATFTTRPAARGDLVVAPSRDGIVYALNSQDRELVVGHFRRLASRRICSHNSAAVSRRAGHVPYWIVAHRRDGGPGGNFPDCSDGEGSPLGFEGLR